MAISSFPFETQDTTEAQFSALFRELQDSGVCDSGSGNGLKVQLGSGSSVDVLPGSALLRGFMVISDDTETLAIGAPDAQTRVDRVVARLDPTANEITLVVVAGTAGGGPPSLQQDLTGVYEIPLARVSVAPNGNITVTDERQFVGMRVIPHTNATRPAANAVRIGQLAFNLDSMAYEYSNGTNWVALKPTLVDQATKWGPGSGYSLIVQSTEPDPVANTIWIKPTA